MPGECALDKCATLEIPKYTVVNFVSCGRVWYKRRLLFFACLGFAFYNGLIHSTSVSKKEPIYH